MGVGAFVLCDPDVIEDTNLNRLVGGTMADVRAATPKVTIAKRLIRAVHPDAEVVLVQAEWQTSGDALKGCDVIVGGLDSVRAKDELDSFCRRFLIPYIDMGMDVHGSAPDYLIAGQVVLSTAEGPCLRCLGIVTEEALDAEISAYGAAGGRPQVVWPNGVLASTAVGLVMQLLTPWHREPVASAYLEYDGNLGQVTPSHRLQLAARKGCSHYLAGERGDPAFDIRVAMTPAPSAAPQVQTFATQPSRMNRLAAWARRLLRS